MKPGSLKVGDQFRLTSEFLRNTGQYTGPEGISKWIVVACECALCLDGGRYVASNQKLDRPDDPELHNTPRHFNTANLEKVRSR